jgi:hypothetical protein
VRGKEEEVNYFEAIAYSGEVERLLFNGKKIKIINNK